MKGAERTEDDRKRKEVVGGEQDSSVRRKGILECKIAKWPDRIE